MKIFLLIFACQGSKETGNTGEEEGLLLNAGGYQLVWNDEDMSAETLLVENNLGYQIELFKGYFSSYSVRLYPCSEISLLQRMFPISSAWAGHSDILVAGNWVEPVVENFLERESVQQEKSFEEHFICDLVYTIARADGSSQNLPEDINFENLSIYVEGVWRKDSEEQGFIWSSNLPAERVFSLDDCSQHEDFIDGKGMSVQLTRDISGAFDDIDFSTVDEQNGSLQILTNLVQDTQLTCWNF